MSSLSKTAFQHYYDDFISPNKHRIQSLYLFNPLIIDFFTTDISQCSQLQTLVLNTIEPECLESLLTTLKSLPKLSSLHIYAGDGSDKTIIYNLVFQLPVLKNCRINFSYLSSLKSLPICTNPSSLIRRLTILDNYDLNDIDTLLSYVPKLRHLSVRSQCRYFTRSIPICLIIFNDSTHLSVTGDRMTSENIEEYIKKHSHRINVLLVSSDSFNSTWEKSILSYLPYYNAFDTNQTTSKCCSFTTEIYQYLYDSSHSIASHSCQRFFTHEPMTKEYLHNIFCSIHPQRNKSFTLTAHIDETKFQCHAAPDPYYMKHVIIPNATILLSCLKYFPNTTKLTLSASNSMERDSYLVSNLQRILPLVQLTKLTMYDISHQFGIFIKLLKVTPNVHTVTWISIKHAPRNLLTLQKTKDYQLVSTRNQVKTIILQHDYTKKMMEVLVHLCPRIQYISLGYSNRSLDATVHYLLSEINQATRHLFSLCIRRATEYWIKYWKEQIEAHEVFNDYSIKVIDRNFYLWWND
ncbi:hypothetical protein I4U23_004018 [Adineta vaga]|nr:hypothetical protein I4U23_004018 [Adineta vaga]